MTEVGRVPTTDETVGGPIEETVTSWCERSRREVNGRLSGFKKGSRHYNGGLRRGW